MDEHRSIPGLRRVPFVLVIAMVSGCVSAVAGKAPVSADGFGPIGPTSAYTGTVELRDNGCIFLELDGSAVWMVWPPGASYESTGEHQSNIRLADNTRIFPGDRLDVTGELITRSGLPQGGNPDTQWGSHARFCLGPTKHDAEILRAVSATRI
jgi:hypothetical protein